MDHGKKMEINHLPTLKSSNISHTATLPKNMTFCNNVSSTNDKVRIISYFCIV